MKRNLELLFIATYPKKGAFSLGKAVITDVFASDPARVVNFYENLGLARRFVIRAWWDCFHEIIFLLFGVVKELIEIEWKP